MAGTNGKEAIDEEIRRRKRVNNEKDACPAKKAKVEGSKAMELPIRVGDNAEGEAAALCDGELNKLRTSTGDKTKEEEAALSDDELNKLRTYTDDNAENGDEVNRLRGLLVYDPKKLSNKDVKNVIRYLEIDEIVSLALKSVQGKGSNDGDTEEEWIDEDDPCVPNSGKQFGILRLMLRRIEKVKEADFSLLYENLPHLDFAPLLLIALDSYSNRCCGGVPLLKVEDRNMIPELCRVLPWKLFAHILSYKTNSLPLLKSIDEVNWLRGLLVYDPKKLSNKDVKNVIRYLEIDEIVSLALKSSQGKGSDDEDTEEEWIDEDDPYAPNSGKQFGILRLMLRRIEKVKEADFSLLYKNLPHLDFAPLLLSALDSYSNRCCGGVPLLKVEDRDMIPELCRVLPGKLFAHILSYKTSLPLLKSTSEETREETSEETIEECTPAQKEAAESCEICFGKGRHFGSKGSNCSYLDYIPNGVTVGPNCWIVCRDCGRKNYNPFQQCFRCDSDAGRVVVIPSCLKNGPFLRGF